VASVFGPLFATAYTEREAGARHESSRGRWRFMHECVADLRLSLRMLRRNPAFTAAAILTLALGIGATTAIFNAADETLLSPLPLPQPQQLVAVYNFDTKNSRYISSSYPDFEDFSKRNHSFQHLSAYVRLPLNLSQAAESISVEAVSADYFSMLELPPLAGRAFGTEESESPVVMLGEEIWRRQEAHWKDDCPGRLPPDDNRDRSRTLPRRQLELG